MIRILGAILFNNKDEFHSFDRMMRLWDCIRVDPEKLPLSYPFMDYERCDFAVIDLDGPFDTCVITKYTPRVLEWGLELSKIVMDQVVTYKADGRSPDVLKVYEDGRIVLKIGPHGDEEAGLLVREAEEAEIKRFLKQHGVECKGIGAWDVARCLGVPDIVRVEQALKRVDVRRLVYLDANSRALE